MRKLHTTPVCHPDRPHAARGMCLACYQKDKPKAQEATCHAGRVAWAKGLCKSCYDKHLRESNPDYKKNQQETTNRWIESNKEYQKAKAKIRSSTDEAKEKKSAYARGRSLNSYGLTLDDELRILQEQNYACPICFGPAGRKGLFDIDHDHDTGKFRGLICHRCNKGLGLLGDNISAVENALAYLRRAEANSR